LAQATTTLPLVLRPEDVCDTRWIALADLTAETFASPARFTRWLRICPADHRAGILGAPGG